MSANSIALRYNRLMPKRQPLPLLWLLSDARNDAFLEQALRALPAGSGFVFRHYHLDPEARRARFDTLRALVKSSGLDHAIVLADRPSVARAWGADGVYGDVARIADAPDMTVLATAHDGPAIVAAGRAGADGVFLSPVYPTRSHPGAPALGIHGFHVLAQQSPIPVIALGGMTSQRAARLHWPRWGAIDGLASPNSP